MFVGFGPSFSLPTVDTGLYCRMEVSRPLSALPSRFVERVLSLSALACRAILFSREISSRVYTGWIKPPWAAVVEFTEPSLFCFLASLARSKNDKGLLLLSGAGSFFSTGGASALATCEGS